MCSLATICVDNNLASRQPRISVRPADDKLTRRIDEIFNVVIEQRQHFLTQLCLYAWHENIDNVFTYLSQHRLIIVHERVVLRAHDNRVNALWNAGIAVFYRHLTLGVGAQIGHLLPFTADIGQRTHQQMRQIE